MVAIPSRRSWVGVLLLLSGCGRLRYQTVAGDGATNVTTDVAVEVADERVADADAPVPPEGGTVTSLIGYWKFDETIGTTAADSSGQGNNGELRRFAPNPWRPGRVGGSLSFDGKVSWVRVLPSASGDAIADANAVSVAAWVRLARVPPLPPPTESDTWYGVLSRAKGPLNRDQFAIGFANGRLAGIINSFESGRFSCRDTIQVAPMVWMHVAMTFDGDFIRVYRDGTEVCTLHRPVRLKPNTDPLVIGGNINNMTPEAEEIMNGEIDELVFYRRALSPAEIAAMAAGGAPPY